MKIAFIGGGNMAAAFIGGLIKRGVAPDDLYAIDPNSDARERNEQQFGISTGAARRRRARAVRRRRAGGEAADPEGRRRSAGAASERNATGDQHRRRYPQDDMSRWLNGHAPHRARDAEYAGADRHGRDGPRRDRQRRRSGSRARRRCWARSAQTVWFDDEAKIDAVTAISGSGPAYVFYFIEALQEAARQLGMDEAQGRALAVATFTGAAQLAAKSDEPPSVLRERVTSKGGTTAAALASFDASGIKDAIVRGVLAADARAKEMGDEFGK